MLAWLEVFTQVEWLGTKLWEWLAGVGLVLAGVIVGKIVAVFIEAQAQRLGRSERLAVLAMLLRCASRPAAVLVFAVGLYVAVAVAHPGVAAATQTTQPSRGLTQEFWLSICETIAALAVGWFIFRLVEILELYLHRWASRTDTPLDTQFVPLIRKTLRVLVIVIVLLFIAQNIFDWNIAAILAGLGVGGLAIALAAKEMVANLLGSVTIFTDKPFRQGDRIIMDGHDGFVEDVGFRSIRLRTLDGSLVVIPNATVTVQSVENISSRPYIRRVLNVTITYDTPPDKVRLACQIIHQMLDARKANFHADWPPRVYFSDFNADSLNIAVYYWFAPPDWWAFQAFNDEFNHELLRRFNEAGIEFAFPTQTVYVKGPTPPSGASPAT